MTELATQSFLRNPKWPNHEVALYELNKAYGIKTVKSLYDPLVILNYCQIESPKRESLVKECRGLTLDYSNNWEVVARSFDRFFNAGEIEDDQFNWDDFVVQEKVDGSLILLYNYRDSWRINTRGSFAQGLCGESGCSWEELVYELLNQTSLDGLDKDCTYIMEFCSLHNMVVTRHDEPKLYLLGIRNNKTGKEAIPTNDFNLGVRLPENYNYGFLSHIKNFLDACPAWFEGFVCVDNNFNRTKVKNSLYVIAHKTRGNGNDIFKPENLLPFILKGETAELLATLQLPGLPERVEYLSEKVNQEYQNACDAWYKYRDEPSQKEFAIQIRKMTELTGMLFTGRKKQLVEFKDVWNESQDYVCKHLSEKFSKKEQPREFIDE